jgi:hypothetical protein
MTSPHCTQERRGTGIGSGFAGLGGLALCIALCGSKILFDLVGSIDDRVFCSSATLVFRDTSFRAEIVPSGVWNEFFVASFASDRCQWLGIVTARHRTELTAATRWCEHPATLLASLWIVLNSAVKLRAIC